MKLYKITTIIAMTALLMSCGNNATENKTKSEIVEHNHDDGEIVLNSGEKWEVADHMMAHIQNMEKDLNEFDGETFLDYKDLSVKLKKNIALLTSNCTMTGQAHDELHKWLLPYIDKVNAFAKTRNKESAIKGYQEVKETFIELNQYFK